MRLSALILAAGLLGGIGCSSSDRSAQSPADSAPEASGPTAATSFVNRVWVVAESPQVVAGEMRVFFSDSTLAMTSPHGTPAFGQWGIKDGGLTITEEGRTYPVDILELTGDSFRIRIRGPGEPVVIRFAPAEQSPLAVSPPAQP